MASSSTQSEYDVFLSFRGEDTRSNFTSHLHSALCQKSIKTFIDDKAIQKGDTLSPTLLAAIERSRISIIIFSKNYASSTWCLDELEKIIECKETKEHVVLPVFFSVDPSDVRHQRGTYQDAFTKHEERFRDNPFKVQKWRTVLHEAANLAGWDSSKISLESELVERIVRDVLQNLNHMYRYTHVPKGLVGITEKIAEVESLLCTGLADVRIVGIWGMGGIGKTTIVEALYTKLFSQFEGCCFVANVREKWKNGGEIDLRNKLLRQILDDQSLDISIPSMTSSFAIERLKRRKVLIILDDVSESEQVEYLVRDNYSFGPGSRIILTTRNRDAFNGGVDEVYQVMELQFDEALKLFSLNAFRQDHPRSDYQHLCKRVVDYAKGIPLALTVIGSSLYSKQLKEWERILEKLKKIPKARICNALRLSYEELDPDEKNIFLDIACCCLKGETKCHITSLLDGCGYSTDIGMRSLEDKSLITVSQNQTVQMHDLIQEMGRQIVREESKDPGKRSRLWDPEEIYDVLKYNKGTDSVEMMALDTSQIKDVTISPQTFTRMHKLRFLNFYKGSNVHIPRELAMPDELIYFRWDNFPLKSLPSSFSTEKLVELDLFNSRVEKLWEGMQDLANLKKLYLGRCMHLIELPDLSMASKLEELYLADCRNLLPVPSYILSLDSLCQLDMRCCLQHVYIQSDTHSRSLRWLNLNGCSGLVGILVYAEKLEFLCLRKTAIEKLPPLWDTCVSLTTLDLDWCSNLSELPENIGLLSALEELSLSESNIETLPGSIKNLPRLRALDVSACRRLLSLPELPPLLRSFSASDCISLKTVSNSGITLLQNSFNRQSKSSFLRQIEEEYKKPFLDCLGRPGTTAYYMYDNCTKLDQNARQALMEEAVTRIQLAAYLSLMIEPSYDPYYQPEPDDEVSKKSDPENIIPCKCQFILPGSEVQNWFSYKKTDSSTITLKLPSMCDNYLGFAFCVVLGPSHSNREEDDCYPFVSFRAMCKCECYFGKEIAGSPFIIFSTNDDAELDLVWLCYDKFSNRSRKTGDLELDPVDVCFRFSVQPHHPGLVVKQCGIRPLFALDDVGQSSNEQGGDMGFT